MVASGAPTEFTEREYLALEGVAETKHEFVGGQIVSMAGAELDHNQICQNLRVTLEAAYSGRPCRVLGSDLRVKCETTRDYFYPDVVVVCGEPRLVDPSPRSLINPSVIIEVLSPSTERYDRGEKWVAYQTITTLTDYVLVASDRRRIEIFQRGPDDGWASRVLSDSKLTLSDASTIDVSAIYRLVDVT